MSDRNSQVYDIVVNLKAVQKKIKNRMHHHFHDMELTAPQGMLIYMISRHETLKISEISNKMGLSNSTVSGIVDRLEARGFVKRVRSEKDRRVVNVTVTELMKEKITSHEDIINKLMSEALDVGTSEELIEIANGLEILNNLLGQIDKGEPNKC